MWAFESLNAGFEIGLSHLLTESLPLSMKWDNDINLARLL